MRKKILTMGGRVAAFMTAANEHLGFEYFPATEIDAAYDRVHFYGNDLRSYLEALSDEILKNVDFATLEFTVNDSAFILQTMVEAICKEYYAAVDHPMYQFAAPEAAEII